MLIEIHESPHRELLKIQRNLSLDLAFHRLSWLTDTATKLIQA
jgi:hypothetical protein